MSAKSARVKKLALLAMFTAIGAVLITLVHFPFSLPLPFSSMILPMSPS
ncbi:hypothetical protein M5E87_26435 [Flavonifractor plautii]|nr:hypothetical protein M5E87_26435 [Flavonifractor plautii]